MFQLVDQGILPPEFAQLKADIPLCASFIYVQAHCKAWHTSGKKLAMSRDTNNSPGKGTSTDQLVSGQPDLIPQIGGHLNAAIIWAANVFVDHFSNLVYVYLMQSTMQEVYVNKVAQVINKDVGCPNYGRIEVAPNLGNEVRLA